MLVKDFMTRHPVMVDPNMSIVEAQGIMVEAGIRHLPVIHEGKRLAGLVTRSSLRIPPASLGSLNVWEISRYLADLKAKDLMVKGKDVITCMPDVTLEDAAQKLVAHKIGCLPVLEDGIVVGIITDSDLLTELSDLLGVSRSGVRVTVRMPDRRGEFAKITNAIASQGWGIAASGGVNSPKHPGFWDGVFRVPGVSVEEVLAVLNEIEDHEIVDIREV